MERRSNSREQCTGKVWWRRETNDWLKQGKLVDRSRTGVSFMVHGCRPPVPGTRILLSTGGPAHRCVHAQTKAVTEAGEGLYRVSIDLTAE